MAEIAWLITYFKNKKDPKFLIKNPQYALTKSVLVFVLNEKGKTETMTMDTTGKWLKADCGNVKPFTPPKK